VKPTDPFRTARAKNTLLLWTKSQACWRKLQVAIHAGTFSVSRRRAANTSLHSVFVWRHDEPMANLYHVDIKDEAVTEIKLRRDLLTLKTASGGLLAHDCRPSSSSARYFSDEVCSTLIPSVRNGCCAIAPRSFTPFSAWSVGRNGLALVRIAWHPSQGVRGPNIVFSYAVVNLGAV
jgi:hypothetical protein